MTSTNPVSVRPPLAGITSSILSSNAKIWKAAEPVLAISLCGALGIFVFGRQLNASAERPVSGMLRSMTCNRVINWNRVVGLCMLIAANQLLTNGQALETRVSVKTSGACLDVRI